MNLRVMCRKVESNTKLRYMAQLSITSIWIILRLLLAIHLRAAFYLNFDTHIFQFQFK